MNRTILGPLTDRHLLLFGTIIQLFARYELLMQELMAAVAGTDAAAIMLMTRSLDFTGKRQALLDLIHHGTVPADQYDRISAFLQVPHAMAALRSDIAHSGWVADPAASAIQPDWILRVPLSIKPLRDNPGDPSRNFPTRERDARLYTLDGLNDMAESLASNYERFSEYLVETKLMRANGRRASAAARS